MGFIDGSIGKIFELTQAVDIAVVLLEIVAQVD